MSLYEIISMVLELEKSSTKARHVTDDEFEQAEELLLSVTLNDPKVRLH